MSHKSNHPEHGSTNELPQRSGQSHKVGMRLDDFFASPTTGAGGPINGGGHVRLKLNAENLEVYDHRDAEGISRRALRGRLIHQGSSLLFNVFKYGGCEEILDSAVTVTFIESDQSKINFCTSGERPEDPWSFEIELTQEQFYYLLRLALGVDPLTGKRILRRRNSGRIEVHGDRFLTDGTRRYSARLLHVNIDDEAETNEYAMNKRAFLQHGKVSH